MSIQPIIVDEEAGESYQGLRMTADEYMSLPETLNYYELIDGVIVQQFWGDPVNVGGYDRDRPIYQGVRMTADEYYALGETYEWYELMDGVVIMSPSPTPRHQAVAAEILRQITNFLDQNPTGIVFYEIDVQLHKRSAGRDGVYRPDLVFISNPRAREIEDRVNVPADLVVEVVSPHSRPRDAITKKEDYEHNGVLEYWLIDPQKDEIILYRLEHGRYVEIPSHGGRFESHSVSGFALDIAAVRKKFALP